jgi:hypothetical protein
MIPLDTSVQAEYADGYILDETQLGDISPYNPTHNVLRAIINGDPEPEHGKLVRFSCFYNNQRHDVDWNGLPANARPIRFRDGFMTLDNAGNEESGWSGCRFGYQYTNNQGRNVQEVQEL